MIAITSGMTLSLPGLAAVILEAIAISAGCAAPVTWVMLRFSDYAVDGTASLLYTGSGKEAKPGYSQEKALARQGKREEACAALLERWDLEQDPSALHEIIAIASKKPVLRAWNAKAAQALLQMESLSADDRIHFENLLKEFSPSLS
jgi:hypothetical protein